MSKGDNIVMETGLGRRKLREYQLKLAKYSDMALLSDFLERSKLSTAEILNIILTEEVESIEALERLLDAAS